MDNKLTLAEVFLIFLGFGYLVNHRSKEIHQLNEKHKNCKIHLITKHNREYVSRRKALRLIKEDGYNGCRWCWDDADKG